MVDPNYEYTKHQLKKHFILLEDHMKSNTCPDCVDKHLSAIEGYAEEGTTQAESDAEKLAFIKIAEAVRKLRKVI